MLPASVADAELVQDDEDVKMIATAVVVKPPKPTLKSPAELVRLTRIREAEWEAKQRALYIREENERYQENLKLVEPIVNKWLYEMSRDEVDHLRVDIPQELLNRNINSPEVVRVAKQVLLKHMTPDGYYTIKEVGYARQSVLIEAKKRWWCAKYFDS